MRSSQSNTQGQHSSMQQQQDRLGPAHIRLAGLQIWVQRRQFPERNDYWDANWIIATVQCGAEGADVWIKGPIIHLPEIERWADEAEQLYKTLSGEANLDCMEPELSVELKAKELGHISMVVTITPNNVTQEHTFQFELDQSFLVGLISDCRRVLREFPIKR